MKHPAPKIPMALNYCGFQLHIVDPIYKGKGDIKNCRCHRAVKLLGHGMKVVERVLKKIHSWLTKLNLALSQREEQLTL